jgi:hypothetical protein
MNPILIGIMLGIVLGVPWLMLIADCWFGEGMRLA